MKDFLGYYFCFAIIFWIWSNNFFIHSDVQKFQDIKSYFDDFDTRRLVIDIERISTTLNRLEYLLRCIIFRILRIRFFGFFFQYTNNFAAITANIFISFAYLIYLRNIKKNLNFRSGYFVILIEYVSMKNAIKKWKW